MMSVILLYPTQKVKPVFHLPFQFNPGTESALSGEKANTKCFAQKSAYRMGIFLSGHRRNLFCK